MIFILLAVILDWILGDPYSLPHPIRLMGNIISYEEKLIRKYFKSDKSLFYSGILIVVVNIFLGNFPLYFLMTILNPTLNFILKVIIYYYCISARMLHYEAVEVRKALERSLEEGRKRVSYIVGRDTENLEENEIIRATVETVAENTSDGVIAPLLYIFLFGPIGGITYKFINTMDSMIGYNNEKYAYLGRAAAIVDDFANYFPARLTAFYMALTEVVPKKVKKVLKIVFRDGKKHLSPNAGFPEAAVAAILGIQLGGNQFYSGKYVEKPTLGDKERNIRKSDINDTVIIMYKTEVLSIFIMLIFSYLILGNPLI